jgi:pimeloyl-ACP methyl ester carboxylesterase
MVGADANLRQGFGRQANLPYIDVPSEARRAQEGQTMEITRHFATLAGRQVHYRHGGTGPAVVLLHQSPTSSREYESLITHLAGRGFAVFAPDMAGYGLSDPHPLGPDVTIEDLADDVAAFLDATGIGQAGIYGFHTGGCIANEFARRHRARATVTIVGGFVCQTDLERSEILANYLPPFVPLADGSHFAWLWSRVKDQKIFFPWYQQEDAARLKLTVGEPAQLHVTAMAFLDAGDAYRSAYGAAFRYRGVDSLPHIKGAQYIVSYEADPLYAHLDRLPPLAPNLQIVRCTTAEVATAKLTEILEQHRAAPAPMPRAPAPRAGALTSDYAGRIRLRRNDDASGDPVVLLHGGGESGRALVDLAQSLIGRRSVVVPDLPGHGDSDELAAATIADTARSLGDALDAIGVARCDLFGQGFGAAVALELALQRPALVQHLALHAVPVFDAALTQALLQQDAPPLDPDFHGGHLSRAWHVARDRGLFFPWFDRRAETRIATRIDTDMIHARTIDLLKAGAAGRTATLAGLRYGFDDALARVTVPVFRLSDSTTDWALTI